MAKKIIKDKNFFDDESGDIIDKVIKEQEFLKSNLPEDKEELILRLDDLEEEKTDLNLNIIAETYHKNFNNQKAINWFNAHGIKKLSRLNELKINVGFSDGTLINMISESQSIELLKLNVLNQNEEQFLNCVTIPVVDNQDQVINIYGININDDKVKSLNDNYLFNQKACKVYDEIILTESIIDALSLIELDFNNVISVENADNFKSDYIKILKDNRVKTVILAFKKTVSAAFSEDKIKKMLLDENIEVKEITQISCEDWNKELLEGITSEDVLNIINAAETFKPEKSNDFDVKKNGLIYAFSINDITYKLSGIKEMFVSNLKVNIRAEYREDRFPDNLDLYSARSRNTYSQNLANIFNIESKRVEKDLIKILEYLEDERDKKLNAGSKNDKEGLTEEEKNLGMEFLKSPDLFQQIIDDMTTLGYVGEDLNKQLVYLCATSRLMDDPISVMIVSQSASGKSYLVDTCAKLMPDDEVIDFHTLSKQALQYMGEKLLNKFMLMGEATHDPDIENQLRQILSGHKLSRYVVMKNEKTGELTTENVKVNAVVSSVLTTTSSKINPENASRYFIVNTDESRDQTRRIYESQKNKYSEERQKEKNALIPDVIKKHRCAQKLLKKISIVIPSKMRMKLKFPDKVMRLRRDFERFIDLIAVVCFLRQYQKETKNNKEFEYIECDKTDYRIAYDILINDVLQSTISEIPQQSVMVYDAVREIAKENSEAENLKSTDVSVSQREIREYTGFNQMFVKRYIKILVDYEYLKVKAGGRGSRACYSLIADEDLNRVDISVISTPDEMEAILNK